MEQDKRLVVSFDLLIPLLVHWQVGHCYYYEAIVAEDFVLDEAAEDVALDAAETVVDTVAEVVNIVADDGGMLFTLQNEVTNNQAAEIRDNLMIRRLT